MIRTILISLLSLINSFAQTINGSFPNLKNCEIQLLGYDGFNEKEFDSTKTDSLGSFILKYPENYKGASLLKINGVSSIVLILNKENFSINWENTNDINTLKITNSLENNFFSEGIKINQESEQKLSGLKYLLTQYDSKSSEFNWIQNQIKKQEQAFPQYILKLPKDSYIKYYLTIRKLVSDFSLALNRYKENLFLKQTEFNNLDFNNEMLWHSGLTKDLFSGVYELIESYGDLSIVNSHANTSTNAWLKSMQNDIEKQQEVAEYCFKILEKKSLFEASEYLALSILNQSNCHLDQKRIDLFEQYRKMAVGNVVPDLNLGNNKKLSSFNNKYKLVVFGASWCPNCQLEYTILKEKYNELKNNYDLEINYISIDTDQNKFNEYYKNAPFFVFCDYKGWETQAAKDFHVFATPTYLLLDNNLKILAKIMNLNHLDSWLKSNK